MTQQKEQKLPGQKSLYRTEKEEQTYRILKKRYGFIDAIVSKGMKDDQETFKRPINRTD